VLSPRKRRERFRRYHGGDDGKGIDGSSNEGDEPDARPDLFKVLRPSEPSNPINIKSTKLTDQNAHPYNQLA
jgi:hypothetical protein